MKKKKNCIDKLKKRQLFKIKQLLLSDEYRKDIKELQDILKNDKVDWRYKFLELKRKYSIHPFSREKLQEIEKALISGDASYFKGNYHLLPLPSVRLVPYKKHEDCDKPNFFGYLTFEINPNTSRYLIHHQIDRLLDHYQRLKFGNSKKKERFRNERLPGLQIWEERRLRKPFKQIAIELKIKEPSAKKRFYKAYELLYGKEYNPVDYEKPEIRKEYLKKNCSTCKEKPTCKDLCPDVIEFVEQDNKKYLREYII